MRLLLALLTIVTCDVPEVDRPATAAEARMILAENAYLVVESPHLPSLGLTDCVDKVIWVRPGVHIGPILVHEAVHVLQAEALGCGAFYAAYALNPDAFENPAYAQEYRFYGCDNDVLEAERPELSPELCD